MFRYYYAIKVRTTTQWCDDNRIVFSAIIIILIVYNVISSCVILTRETREWPVKPAEPLTRTLETPTRKTWGKGLTGTGLGLHGFHGSFPGFMGQYNTATYYIIYN